MTSHDAQERRRDSRHRAEQSFGIVNPALPPDVLSKNHPIYKGREASFFGEISGCISRRRESCHQQPVGDKQGERDQELSSDLSRQEDKRRNQVTERDPLQHSGNPNCRQLKIRKRVEKQAETKNDRRAFDDFEIQVALTCALFDATRKCERDRYADNKQKEWENEIRGRSAMPFRMLQRPVDAGPCAGIIYKHHARDRQTAKDVERHEAPAGVCRKHFGGHRFAVKLPRKGAKTQRESRTNFASLRVARKIHVRVCAVECP